VADAREDSRALRWLLGLVELAHRRALPTLVAITVGTVLAGGYAATHLRFNADPNALFSKGLRFQQMIAKFQENFPVLTDSLLIVVDEGPPEATRRVQQDLAAALAQREDAFYRVFLPGEEPFFEESGLLYGDVDSLDDFADQMARMQPLLAELAQDPSLPTLTHLIELGLEDARDDPAADERWVEVLDRFGAATTRAFDAVPVALSWEQLLLANSPFDPSTLRVIVADPKLDRGRVLAAEDPIRVVREAIAELGPLGGARVRITGYPALNHEEMLGLATDTAVAGTLSFVLAVIVLWRAFRSPRMVFSAALTLLVGLVGSAAFAAATVSELNPISITFFVLVIGLGVDFMIHFGMHVTHQLRAGDRLLASFQETTRQTGSSLVLCAATTAVGFLAFVPTEYRGVSDLGLMASGGMVLTLLMTLTLLPALLTLLIGPKALEALARLAPPTRKTLPLPPPVPVCVISLLLGALALTLLDELDLDTNVVRMRNPDTESVQAFNDLLEDGLSTPWYADVLATSLPEADRIASELRGSPLVDRVVTLTDFVPEEQEEKLEILRDVSMFLDIPPVTWRDPPPAAEQLTALRELRDFLERSALAQGSSVLAQSARHLEEVLNVFLPRAAADPEPALAALEKMLIGPFPAQIERLQRILAVEAIGVDDLPEGLRERMVSPGGLARVQVYPTENLENHDAMVRFVTAVRAVDSEITGLPVNLVESAQVSWDSLREALLWAILAIALLLVAIWRNLGDAAIALAPLLLAVLLTQVSTEFLPVSFNFANVVVLPLILGIGIDSGVHLVSRAKAEGSTEDLLASTTARAVLYSAVTTIASFGTLAISDHRGVASLGVLLVVGMLLTLAANLILLPALLTLRLRLRSRPA